MNILFLFERFESYRYEKSQNLHIIEKKTLYDRHLQTNVRDKIFQTDEGQMGEGVDSQYSSRKTQNFSLLTKIVKR